MIRIITTRKLRFYSPDRTENFVTSGNNIIEDCPDWAEKDGMFQAAKAHGVLQVITAPAQKVLENNLVLPQNAHEANAMLEGQNPNNESGDNTPVETKKKKKKSKAPKE